MKIELPWPPSVNSYLAIVGRRKVKTKAAREYCQKVAGLLLQSNFRPFGDSRLSVHVDAFPPCNRRRDLDNLFKAILDSLGNAGLYNDDSQIDQLSIRRREKERGGKVLILIKELD